MNDALDPLEVLCRHIGRSGAGLARRNKLNELAVCFFERGELFEDHLVVRHDIRPRSDPLEEVAAVVEIAHSLC
jgi:hypothetical protein